MPCARLTLPLFYDWGGGTTLRVGCLVSKALSGLSDQLAQEVHRLETVREPLALEQKAIERLHKITRSRNFSTAIFRRAASGLRATPKRNSASVSAETETWAMGTFSRRSRTRGMLTADSAVKRKGGARPAQVRSALAERGDTILPWDGKSSLRQVQEGDPCDDQGKDS